MRCTVYYWVSVDMMMLSFLSKWLLHECLHCSSLSASAEIRLPAWDSRQPFRTQQSAVSAESSTDRWALLDLAMLACSAPAHSAAHGCKLPSLGSLAVVTPGIRQRTEHLLRTGLAKDRTIRKCKMENKQDPSKGLGTSMRHPIYKAHRLQMHQESYTASP